MKNVFLRLLGINRFSNMTMSKPDTDAEHTIRMQLMALDLYNRCQEFDIKDTCFRILCHDLEECWMCDIPRPVKYHDEKILKELNRVQSELIDTDNVNSTIREYMNKAKDDTVEGWIVRFLDVYDAYSTLKREAWIQHSDAIYEDSKWSFDLLCSLKEEIVRNPEFPKKLACEISLICSSDEKFNFKERSV